MSRREYVTAVLCLAGILVLSWLALSGGRP